MSILDLLKEVPLSAVLKEKIARLESENESIQSENAILKVKLEQSEQQRRTLEEQIIKNSHDNPDGYVCDHCAGKNLRRTGSRPDPTFGSLGIKRKVFMCNDCGKESSFMPSSEERKRA